VAYFRNIDGFNLKEAVNLCLKEGLKDSITPSFTWWGREGGQRGLCIILVLLWQYMIRYIFLYLFVNIFICLTNDSVFCISFSEAVSNNRHFEKPTRSDFQMHMREALRTAKERLRHRLRGSRTQTANFMIRRQDFWNDERPEQIIEQTNV